MAKILTKIKYSLLKIDKNCVTLSTEENKNERIKRI